MRTLQYRGIKIKSKQDSKTMKFIGLLFKIVGVDFMNKFWTTWFGTIYVPATIDLNLINEDMFLKYHEGILEHELIHIQDMKKYHIWFYLTYICPPIFFAYGRFFWERKAYLPELKKLRSVSELVFLSRLGRVVNTLGGPAYLWTWPKSSIRKWFLKNA